MNDSIQTISFARLGLTLVPVACVVAILYKWSLDYRNALYGMSRMLAQLILIGYVLAYIFQADTPWIVLAVMTIMVFTSSWIALRTLSFRSGVLYGKAIVSIALAGGAILVLVTQWVLNLQPWYYPSYMIPLAGMIFANAMNSVSLAAERLEAETKGNNIYEKARGVALRTSLIPITNSLFAVGLVSLPGMMTGQILSGISPLIAVRYQIMVMCMLFGSAGIASALFLSLVKPDWGKAVVEPSATSVQE